MKYNPSTVTLVQAHALSPWVVNAGFTLVELLIGVALTAFIMMALTLYFQFILINTEQLRTEHGFLRSAHIVEQILKHDIALLGEDTCKAMHSVIIRDSHNLMLTIPTLTSSQSHCERRRLHYYIGHSSRLRYAKGFYVQVDNQPAQELLANIVNFKVTYDGKRSLLIFRFVFSGSLGRRSKKWAFTIPVNNKVIS